MKKIILNRPVILKNINLNNFSQKDFYDFFEKNKRNKNYFRWLGRGQNREVFMFQFNNKRYIIKKLIKSHEANQNINEYTFYKIAKEKGLEKRLSNVLLNFSNDNYILMEYSEDIKYVPYFEKIYHINKEHEEILKTYNFKGRVPFNNIYYACCRTRTNFKEFIKELDNLQKIGLDLEDLYLDNLGVQNKKLVIRDFGFCLQED